MTKQCGFCKAELTDNRVFEVCNRCGFGIWGEKMFKTICENMQRESPELWKK